MTNRNPPATVANHPHSTTQRALLWSLLAGVAMSTACGNPALEQDTAAATEVGTAPASMMHILRSNSETDAGYYLVADPSGVPVSADYVEKMGHRFDSLEELSTHLNGMLEVEILDVEVTAGPFQPLSLNDLDLLSIDNHELFRSYEDIFAMRASAVGGWGRGKSSKGNCYRYATNDPLQPDQSRKEHQAIPDDLTGFGDMPPAEACDALLSGAIEDGAEVLPAPDTAGEEACEDGDVMVCAVVAPDGTGGSADFHWYREDSDGTWSHKPGYLAVSDRDASDKQITDPETCDRNYGDINYSEYCGCLCIPGGSIDVDESDTDKYETSDAVIIDG
jgi:hypothetical protein